MRLLSEEIAKRSEEITNEIWKQVNEFNREMVQDYLDNQTDLSLNSSGISFWIKSLFCLCKRLLKK